MKSHSDIEEGSLAQSRKIQDLTRQLIDEQSLQFTSSTRAALGAPGAWPVEALAWLCTEHFQFSFRNPAFLLRAASNTLALQPAGIAEELKRNYEEERSHAEIYRRALSDVGIDVEARKEFKPTTEFLAFINDLVESNPSRVVGAMYATETAAIFEHEVFRDISAELVERRAAGSKGKRLLGFHDMHLSGVEQAHKDNLGAFLTSEGAVAMEQRGLDPIEVREGAEQAIRAMRLWWENLLQKARTLQPSA